MKPLINILFSCDTNYAMPMTVCITSIFENNKENQVNIYVLYSSLSEQQKEILINLAEKYKQKMELIAVPDHYFSTAPTLRWTKETYYRLLVTDLLPQELERIIYLDCDTIVNKNLNTLYQQDLGENFIGATKTEMKYSDFGPRLNLKDFDYYYQCGVILFDINKCRKTLNYKKVEEIIKFLGDRLLVVDQDIINVIFYKKIKEFPIKFNNDEITNYYRSNFNRLFNKKNDKLINETIVFHYAAGKPWNNIFPGSCEDVWYTYLKLSPYKDLYYKKYNTVKYKILRTNLMKIFFHEYTHITPYINKIFFVLFPISFYNKLKAFYRKKIK